MSWILIHDLGGDAPERFMLGGIRDDWQSVEQSIAHCASDTGGNVTVIAIPLHQALAATELLEACVDMLEQQERDYESDEQGIPESGKRARTAIAKAEP